MEKIPVIKFFKHKYGDELLIDLNDIDCIRSGIGKYPIHRYHFYGMVLVTGGQEEIGINDNTAEASPGLLVAGIPGDVWRWRQDTQLDGYVLIFEEEFLLSFFGDRQFLSHFPFLDRRRSSPFYRLEGELYSRVCSVMRQIQTEIHGDETDMCKTSLSEIDHHILRALLYEVLALCKRADSCITPVTGVTGGGDTRKRYMEPFISLVEKHFTDERSIGYYADRLCITPNYLNKIVKQALGMSAKGYVNRRTVQEIRNLLDYTSLSVAEIAVQLHFLSASYLVRYFKAQTGMTPLEYRAAD